MLTSCPVCQRQVSPEAYACPACGHPLRAGPTPSAGVSAEPAAETTAVYVYTSQPGAGAAGRGAAVSNVQPVWQYVLLQVCSFGAYDLFWFFLTWRLLKERHRLYITPAARALFPLLFAVHLCRENYRLAEDAGHKPNWKPAAVGWSYILLELFAGPSMRQAAPAMFLAGVALFAGSIYVRLPLVRSLNDFWRHEQPRLPERNRLSGKAWVVVMLGSLWWILTFMGQFSPTP